MIGKRRNKAVGKERRNRADTTGGIIRSDQELISMRRRVLRDIEGTEKPLKKMNECRIKGIISLVRQLRTVAMSKAVGMKAKVKKKVKVRQTVTSKAGSIGNEGRSKIKPVKRKATYENTGLNWVEEWNAELISRELSSSKMTVNGKKEAISNELSSSKMTVNSKMVANMNECRGTYRNSYAKKDLEGREIGLSLIHI